MVKGALWHSPRHAAGTFQNVDAREIFVNLAWEPGERCERQEEGQTWRADYSTQDIKAEEIWAAANATLAQMPVSARGETKATPVFPLLAWQNL